MNKVIKIILLSIFQVSCSQNILIGSSTLSPDEDYYNQAMAALNSEKYDDAITIVNTKITTNGQTTVKVRDLLASSYAGKCGLNFIDYTKALSDQTTGSALYVMMSPFVQKIVDPDSCKLSIQTLELIGPTEVRTTNQNVFASIVGMVLLGSALRTYSDQSPALGDGVPDIDLCSAVTDSQINDMIIGFGYFNKNFAAVSSTLVGTYSDSQLGTIGATCANVAGSACTVIDAAQITAPMRDAFRRLINTKEFGVGAFVTGGDENLIPMSCP